MAKKAAASAPKAAARQPTLGQATGGRPGRVPAAAPKAAARPAPAAATPRPPRTPGLGLGLGLNAGQRGAFQGAAQQGQGQQWLGAHPNIQTRANAVAPGGWRANNMQNFLQTGQAQQRPTPQPPTVQGMPPPGNVGMAGGNPQPPAFGGNFAQGTGDQLTAAGMGQMGGGGMYGGMRPLGGPGSFGAMMGAQTGGPFAGYSPAMQQILQARGMGGGGMGPGSWSQSGGYQPFSQMSMGGAMGNYGGGGGMGPWGMSGGSMGQYPQGSAYGASLGRQTGPFAFTQGMQNMGQAGNLQRQTAGGMSQAGAGLGQQQQQQNQAGGGASV